MKKYPSASEINDLYLLLGYRFYRGRRLKELHVDKKWYREEFALAELLYSKLKKAMDERIQIRKKLKAM